MPDVEITYNNSTIASLSDSGTEVLETSGTYLTDDITVQYTKSGGGSGLPDTPGTDGTYALMNTVESGTGAVSWVKPLVVTITNYSPMSSTFEEISDALQSGRPVIIFEANDYSVISNAVTVSEDERYEGSEVYRVMFVRDPDVTATYTTFSRNGYPELEY